MHRPHVVRDSRFHLLTVTERAELKKVMIKTHSEMASRIGKETIDAIYEETGFDPAKL